ncbi:ParB/RepB/Spo0J family partition protein [Bradyrhizobium sp. CCBAU 65884]|uniref:ParB/RepB/Spo0J family partition protein n=1 Tax=Bradyrhizobium sp. CCBAU 65884 TaxID=722477 RepID=UPI0023067345|nr:ParB N-terminal domain-containing protein [Bradyrhizobium sp. CCBAU 65884]
MEQRAVDTEGDLGSLDSTSVEARQHFAPVCRPYGFPRLQRPKHTIHCSPRPDNASDPASNLAQAAKHPNASSCGSKAPDPTSGATLLLSSPFDGSPAADGGARMDAFRLVPLADISTAHRHRGVVDEFTPVMVESMSTLGVIQPPTVRPDAANPGKFLLVAGMQRINAARVRGVDTILCRVVPLSDAEAELWEIDENLVRAALSPAEEAILISRRRALHEQMYGKSKARGAAAANVAMGRNNATAKLAVASFSADTAKRTGKSERAIQRIVQRATQNGHTNLARVVGTSLDHGAELDALFLLPPATQENLIQQATAGAKVSAVQACKEMNEPSPVTESSEAASLLVAQSPVSIAGADDLIGLGALKSAWSAASASAREAFLSWVKTNY